jgi:hypothetical protein
MRRKNSPARQRNETGNFAQGETGMKRSRCHELPKKTGGVKGSLLACTGKKPEAAWCGWLKSEVSICE